MYLLIQQITCSTFFLFNSRLDKKVYVSGETALLHVDVKNNSNVDIDSFIVKVVTKSVFFLIF